jgi:hypothetical protein
MEHPISKMGNTISPPNNKKYLESKSIHVNLLSFPDGVVSVAAAAAAAEPLLSYPIIVNPNIVKKRNDTPTRINTIKADEYVWDFAGGEDPKTYLKKRKLTTK